MKDLPIILIEVVLVLGSVLALGFWQLWSLRREERRDQEAEPGDDDDRA